uniref:Uncharacterized protein n=1 Tax=Avena sativa TaxID=4498 RepID=A0ACD5YK80_AVESA
MDCIANKENTGWGITIFYNMVEHLATRVIIFLSYVALTFGNRESTDQDAFRTILTKDGDRYKCISINQQPSLRHPLLTNHKIQMKPSSYPIELYNRSLSAVNNSLAELPTISCPTGTIPILQDIKGGSTNIFFHTKNADERAEVAGAKINDDVYGTSVSINVYEPTVKEKTKDISTSFAVLLNAQNKSHLEAIGAGSIVWPSFRGDTFARFHISWMDRTHSGRVQCYDHECPGFVQVGNIGLGGRILPVSIYNGPQYQINVLLFKDPKSKDWWLATGNTLIGYWPSQLFTILKDKAVSAFWGGQVAGPTVQENFPEMGSGHPASEGYGKAAFMGDIKIVDRNNKYAKPDFHKSFAATSKKKCYSVDSFGQDERGLHVYYGGAGGCKR